MDLNNEFRVSVPVSEAWKVLTDVERIAPLLPGAQLQEVEGDEYRGVVKVKVGPISAQYKGVATFVERDEAAGKVVLKATGRDTRGQGNANALITANMSPDGDGTKVAVLTDLTVTGKVAQFGRGVLAEVSAKLMGQFADALEADLESGGASGSADGAAEGGAASGEAAAGDAASGGTASGDAAASTGATGGEESSTTTGTAGEGSSAASGPRKIDAPEAEPLDLLSVAGGSTFKRLLPAFGGILIVLFILMRRRSGRSD